MRLLLCLSILFIFHLSAYAEESSWEGILGCYSTVSMNGTPVKAGPDVALSLTRITRDYSDNFTDLVGTKILSIVMSVYSGYQVLYGGYQYMLYEEPAFLDRGSFGSNGTSLTYQFDGQLLSPPWGNQRTHLTESFEVTVLSNKELQLHAQRKSSIAGPQYDQNNIFVLSPAACL